MSGIKYTLTLHTDGKEVWKRWSGDREEIIRLAAPALVDMEVSEQVAEMFMIGLLSADPEPGGYTGSTSYSKDLRSTLTFTAKASNRE